MVIKRGLLNIFFTQTQDGGYHHLVLNDHNGSDEAVLVAVC